MRASVAVVAVAVGYFSLGLVIGRYVGEPPPGPNMDALAEKVGAAVNRRCVTLYVDVTAMPSLGEAKPPSTRSPQASSNAK